MAVSLMEFGMFKSEKLNKKVVEKIIEGYRSVKPLNYSSKEIWEAILFLCYLYFAYNVIQADNKFESEIYLKRIDTLVENPELFRDLIGDS